VRLRPLSVNIPVACAQDARRAQVLQRVDRFHFFFSEAQVCGRDVDVLQELAVAVCFPQLHEDVEVVGLLAGHVQDHTGVADHVRDGVEGAFEAEFLGVVVHLQGWGIGLVGEGCWLIWLEWRQGLVVVEEQCCVLRFWDWPVCERFVGHCQLCSVVSEFVFENRKWDFAHLRIPQARQSDLWGLFPAIVEVLEVVTKEAG